jgi:hypothetical protein
MAISGMPPNMKPGCCSSGQMRWKRKYGAYQYPELHQKLTEGFQFVLPADSSNVFIATSQGFIHFNPETYWSKDTVLQLVLSEVRLKIPADSILFGGYGNGLNQVKLSSTQNTLSFSFPHPTIRAGSFINYAFYLEGIEKTWSDWTSKPDATFSHLRPGAYTFHVKARNQYGTESAPVSYSFTILPPWYASRSCLCLLLYHSDGYHGRYRLQATKKIRRGKTRTWKISTDSNLNKMN